MKIAKRNGAEVTVRDAIEGTVHAAGRERDGALEELRSRVDRLTAIVGASVALLAKHRLLTPASLDGLLSYDYLITAEEDE